MKEKPQEIETVAPSWAGLPAPGSHVVLNAWMTVPEGEALDAVNEAMKAGDDGVYAVPYAMAIKAQEMYTVLRELDEYAKENGFANAPKAVVSMVLKARAVLAATEAA